jgi:CRP-like cAMP-binding protein
VLELGEELHRPHEKLREVYFPEGSLVSLLVSVDPKSDIEVGMVGGEGMVGQWLALGFDSSPARALVQHPGLALRTTVARLRAELGRSAALRRELTRGAYNAMATAMQISGCNTRHTLESRLARWLLMTRDRVWASELSLTQHLLAQMLGVQREGVTKAATALRRRKLIDYERGRLRILDHDGLHAAACSCYDVIRKLDGAKYSPQNLRA